MKKYLLLLLMSTYTITVHADQIADQFALQAGNIGGAAEQCGQDVTTFITRSKEAITAITPDASEQAEADSVFDKAVADALANQSSVMRKMSCSDVLTTYNSLPILRSDYKQSVIAVLANYKVTHPAATTAQAQNTSPQIPAADPSLAQSQPQNTDQQIQSPIESAIANEMNVPPNNVQSYVSANDNNSNNNITTSTNNFMPTTAMPSSDNIAVSQSYVQGNFNSNIYSGASQNSIANTP